MKEIFILWNKEEELYSSKKEIMSILKEHNLNYIKRKSEVIIEDCIKVIFKKITTRRIRELKRKHPNPSYLFANNSIFLINVDLIERELIEKPLDFYAFNKFFKFSLFENMIIKILIEIKNPKELFIADTVNLIVSNVTKEDLQFRTIDKVFFDKKSAYIWLKHYLVKVKREERLQISKLKKAIHNTNKNIEKISNIIRSE